MDRKSWMQLLLWIIAFQIIGLSLGLLTKANIPTWYNGLHKSSLTPPGWVFGVIWSIIYALLAIVGWALWQQRNNKALRPTFYLFNSQLLMNWAWTFFFFHLHWIGFSLVWIVLITLLVFLTIYSLPNQKKEIGVLLRPYLMWLLFATYLNYAIWALN